MKVFGIFVQGEAHVKWFLYTVGGQGVKLFHIRCVLPTAFRVKQFVLYMGKLIYWNTSIFLERNVVIFCVCLVYNMSSIFLYMSLVFFKSKC